MISRRVGMYPSRAQPTFSYCDCKAFSRAYLPNEREVYRERPFSFSALLGICHKSKPNKNRIIPKDYGRKGIQR